ncbi:hypothetical protein BCSAG_48500 [Bacillus cereus]|uniref:Uncharacterized protein n=1 Tax=Bacillus cereus TaxID=1396 RepID=A0ABD4LNM0_BACCE|nr:hypothetical protein [Bacillus cereus]MBK1611754.1 hypothetical protein [Bacillus cereus]
MMVNTLTEVKKEIKSLDVTYIELTMDAFGEGYNVHATVSHAKNRRTKYFTLSEEEKIYQGEARRKRVKESLEKQGYKVIIGDIYK